jgi:hypothetical protein
MISLVHLLARHIKSQISSSWNTARFLKGLRYGQRLSKHAFLKQSLRIFRNLFLYLSLGLKPMKICKTMDVWGFLMNGCPMLFEPGRRNMTGELDSHWKRRSSTLIRSLNNRRQTEKRINSFPNYTVPIPDQAGQLYNVHFVGLFSENPEAIPIVMLHGWPGIIIILSPNYTLGFYAANIFQEAFSNSYQFLRFSGHVLRHLLCHITSLSLV